MVRWSSRWRSWFLHQRSPASQSQQYSPLSPLSPLSPPPPTGPQWGSLGEPFPSLQCLPSTQFLPPPPSAQLPHLLGLPFAPSMTPSTVMWVWFFCMSFCEVFGFVVLFVVGLVITVSALTCIIVIFLIFCFAYLYAVGTCHVLYLWYFGRISDHTRKRQGVHL